MRFTNFRHHRVFLRVFVTGASFWTRLIASSCIGATFDLQRFSDVSANESPADVAFSCRMISAIAVMVSVDSSKTGAAEFVSKFIRPFPAKWNRQLNSPLILRQLEFSLICLYKTIQLHGNESEL